MWGKILLIVLYLLRTEQAEELPLYFHYLLHFAFKQAKNEPYEDECQHQCIISNHCDKKKIHAMSTMQRSSLVTATIRSGSVITPAKASKALTKPLCLKTELLAFRLQASVCPFQQSFT